MTFLTSGQAEGLTKNEIYGLLCAQSPDRGMKILPPDPGRTGVPAMSG